MTDHPHAWEATLAALDARRGTRERDEPTTGAAPDDLPGLLASLDADRTRRAQVAADPWDTTTEPTTTTTKEKS